MYVVKQNETKIIGAILSLVIFFFSIRNIGILNMPSIVGDEFGYWATAATFGGYDWSGLASTFSSYYGYGYGMLLSIIIWIVKDMQLAYQCAILVNGFLVVVGFLISYKTLKLMFNHEKPVRLMLISFIVTFYPSVQHNTQFAWAETILYFVFWVSCYLLAKYLNTFKRGYLLATTISTVFLFMIHQRSIGILFALIISLLLIKDDNKKKRHRLILCTLAICILFFVHMSLKNYQEDKLWNSTINVDYQETLVVDKSIDVNDFSGQTWKFKTLFTAKGIEYFIVGFLGKIFYFGLSSMFIGYFGLYYSIKNVISIIKKKGSGTNIEVWTCFVGFAYLSLVAISTLYFIIPERIDTVIYGRYSDWATGPILILGILEIFRNKSDKKFMLFLLATELYGLFFMKLINDMGLWSFYSNCSPIGMGFREEMNCDVNWVLLMLQVMILLSVLIFSICKIVNKKIRYTLLCVLLIGGWIFITNDAISYNINMGKKQEMSVISQTIKNETENKITYFVDPKVGSDAHIYSVQYLLGEQTIGVSFFDSTNLSEISQREEIIIINNTESYHDFKSKLNVIKETETFVLGYINNSND